MEALHGFLLVTMRDTDYGTHNWNIFWQSKVGLHKRERALLDSAKMQMMNVCRFCNAEAAFFNRNIVSQSKKQVFINGKIPFRFCKNANYGCRTHNIHLKYILTFWGSAKQVVISGESPFKILPSFMLQKKNDKAEACCLGHHVLVLLVLNQCGRMIR